MTIDLIREEFEVVEHHYNESKWYLEKQIRACRIPALLEHQKAVRSLHRIEGMLKCPEAQEWPGFKRKLKRWREELKYLLENILEGLGLEHLRKPLSGLFEVLEEV